MEKMKVRRLKVERDGYYNNSDRGNNILSRRLL